MIWLLDNDNTPTTNFSDLNFKSNESEINNDCNLNDEFSNINMPFSTNNLHMKIDT